MNTEKTGPVAEVERLTVRFGRTTAVDEASFVVERGEVYALLGRNGSGKSTTVRCLLGQLKPAAGNVAIFGRGSWVDRRAIMERVGVAPEVSDIPPEMTALQVSRFVKPLYSQWDHQAFMERLDRFGVDPQRRNSRLSKGQRKQVGLALALSSAPDLVILDDPTLGLDPVARKALFDELIGELAERGTTVLLTTHDLAGIEGVATRVGVIREGRMVVDENLEILKAGFRRVRFPRPEGGGIPQIPGILHSNMTGDTVEVVVPDFSHAVEIAFREVAGGRMEISSLSLEEIFIAVSNGADGGAS
ncbi:MAG: ABC transporter ATP-binding protein [Acidobacteria bacterium]|nr:ABC transporter ATP-binding protein [Acidobacteriota bacterium]